MVFAPSLFGHRTRHHCNRYGKIIGYLARKSMPTILRTSGFRFFFDSLEGSEPPHIHVEHGDSVEKFWLDPVSVAESHGFRSHELNRLRAMVVEHRFAFMETWDAHFRR